MLCDNLKIARIRCRLKQAEVASMIGCASTSFSNWESGRVNIPLDKLEALCKIYGVKPVDLLDKTYQIDDIVEIAEKPITERSFEENVALAFCGDSISSVWPERDYSNINDVAVLEAFQFMGPNSKRLLLDICAAIVSCESKDDEAAKIIARLKRSDCNAVKT